MRSRQVHAQMTALQSYGDEFEDYQFTVEFVGPEWWGDRPKNSGSDLTVLPSDLWCTQDFILFLPFKSMIFSVRDRVPVSSEEYVSWQIAQADSRFLFHILRTTSAWREPISKLIDYWVSKHSKSGGTPPRCLNIDSLTDSANPDALLLIEFLRNNDGEEFYNAVAKGCLDYESGFFAGLDSQLPESDPSVAISVPASFESTICLVGEGSINTTFTDGTSRLKAGLCTDFRTPRFVSFRNHKIYNDSLRIHRAIHEDSERITDLRMGELGKFLESDEQRKRPRTFHSRLYPPVKSVEECVDILTGRKR